MKPRLAAVFAHPDDDAYLIGGTLARHAGSVDVTIVLCTSGGNGPIWAPVATRETLAEVREREEAEWLRSIGVPDARVEFLRYVDWHLSEGGGVLSRALVQRYRVTLEHRNLAPSTINQHLSAIRALANECGESGLLEQPTAASMAKVNRTTATAEPTFGHIHPHMCEFHARPICNLNL